MKNVKLLILGITMGLAGWSILIWQTNWLVGLGTFLAVWGNNIEIRYSQESP
jgi:hypothetical protein